MNENFLYDVFLSHSSKDKTVVRPLAERLRKDGLKVWFDEWVLKPGDSIPAKIEEGLEHSRVLLLCMSANAFGSEWAQLEAGTFRFRDPLNKERRFIPLQLDDTPIKGSLVQFLYINWNPADREQEYEKLLEACRHPVCWPLISNKKMKYAKTTSHPQTAQVDVQKIQFPRKVASPRRHKWKQISEENIRRNIEGDNSDARVQPINVLIIVPEHPTVIDGYYEFAKEDAFHIRNALLPFDAVDVLKASHSVLISEALLKAYQVIQFQNIGVSSDGSLQFGTENITPSALAGILGNRDIKCAIFMACNSASIIGALNATDIPCVIAATSMLSASYCRAFCYAFYSSLSKGSSLGEAFSHANTISSHEASSISPAWRDLWREGGLVISTRHPSNAKLILR